MARPGAGPSLRPVRNLVLIAGLAAAFALSLVPGPAAAQPAPQDLAAALESTGKADADIRAFYQARGYRPLWGLGDDADRLLDLVETAAADGLDPRQFRARALASAVKKARRGSPKAQARAELLLSRTFADYVRAARRPGNGGMVYADPAVVPAVPSRMAVLRTAAAAPSLDRHLESMGWMHPLYAGLRQALLEEGPRGRSTGRLQANLERARLLPSDPGLRYVVVDAASARLWMYEGGVVRDTMKVVVGKPENPTPMMAGMIRFATLNPYWNIPPDLVQTQVAGNVLKQGLSYIKTKRYQLLSDWSEKPKVLNPAKIDWKAVAAGRQELRARQLPGKANAMGKMKFMFPNSLGIYLHDTPERELLREPARQFSAGCVRLEDAPRLAKWLFGKPLVASSTKPEQKVDLPRPVPIYITYLTAAAENGRVAFLPDVYNLDSRQIAAAASGNLAGR